MTTVAFDTETKGLDWWNTDQQAFLATWATEKGEWHADLSDTRQAATFLQALKDADTIVAHNLSFDVHQVRETLGFDILTETNARLYDTDIISRVLYPDGQRDANDPDSRGGHGLKELASVYLRADARSAEDHIEQMASSMGLKLKGPSADIGAYYDVWRAYPLEMEKYARDDARFTFDLYQRFLPELTGKVGECYALEQATTPYLIQAEQRGIRVDQGAVYPLKKFYERQAEKAYATLEQELGEEALGGKGSEDALIEALIKIGIPLHEKTKTGKLAVNKFALQKFEAEFPIIATLFEYRTAKKFLSTYIGPMVDRSVVHPSFKQCGAWTGRMSCMRPNMQNIPKRAGKEVRAMFVPRDDHSFIVADYESIEVRLLAYYLNDPGFIELITGGHDPHAWMAANIWGGEPGDFHKDGPNAKQRGLAKNILFAITYGAGNPRVTSMLIDADFPVTKVDERGASPEGAALLSKIKSSLPRYHKLNGRIKKKLKTTGYVQTLFGRVQTVSKGKEYVGLNALIQGSAADIMKQGLVNVSESCRSLGGQPVLTVHDEIVVEIPTENAQEALPLVERAMVEAYPLAPPLSVSGTIVSTNYADA